MKAYSYLGFIWHYVHDPRFKSSTKIMQQTSLYSIPTNRIIDDCWWNSENADSVVVFKFIFHMLGGVAFMRTTYLECLYLWMRIVVIVNWHLFTPGNNVNLIRCVLATTLNSSIVVQGMTVCAFEHVEETVSVRKRPTGKELIPVLELLWVLGFDPHFLSWPPLLHIYEHHLTPTSMQPNHTNFSVTAN